MQTESGAPTFLPHPRNRGCGIGCAAGEHSRTCRPQFHEPIYFFKMRSALVSIFFLSDALSFP